MDQSLATRTNTVALPKGHFLGSWTSGLELLALIYPRIWTPLPSSGSRGAPLRALPCGPWMLVPLVLNDLVWKTDSS